MRNILFMLFLAFVFVACVKETKTTIRFDIRDYDGTAPRIVIGFENQEVMIDSAGRGYIELNLTVPTYATVYVRKYESKLCFLAPGEDLALSYSVKKGEKEIAYSGSLAEENQFLNQVGFYRVPVLNYKDRDIQACTRKVDSVLVENRDKLKRTTLSKEFKEWENKRIWINSFAGLLRVPIIDTALYLQTIRRELVEDSTYLAIPAYREFLDQYIRMLVQVNGKSSKIFEGTELADRRLECILGNIKEPTLLSYLVDMTLFHFGEQGIEKYKNVYNQYVKNPKRLALFAEACRKAERIAPGQPCPDFQFADNTGKTVALKDLKGKFVYLDIWATWCGPCKGEMPSLQLLEKRFEGKDILFVSLSVDRNKDIELWKQTIEKMGLGGIQLHLGEDWDWLKNFMPASMSVPRFILLDREGKIIDASMSRPSDKVTAERLEALL